MLNVATFMGDYQLSNDKRRPCFCHHCSEDKGKKAEMHNQSEAAQSFTYEVKNPSWIALLKDQILSS